MAYIQVGNYAFKWTDLHPTSSELEPLRQQYDELGSATVNVLHDLVKKSREECLDQPKGPIDLYAVLKKHHADNEIVTEFWNEIHSVPEWVDWEQLRRGQDFFYRYALANLMGFALQGFMGENSAAKGVVEVLVRTGGFSTRKLLHRLLETFQFVLQVTESLDAIQPGGVGHISAVRVRLLHSSVRERILKLIKTRPEYFNVDKFGAPVNILDSIHSISVFCCNHSWLQLPFMGITPTEQETADYIALFRYVGYLLGVPDGHFTSPAKARATMESMLLHELRLSSTSHTIAYNFVQCVTDLPPFNVSEQFIVAGTRALNGDTFSDSLGLGRPNLIYYASFRGFCWLVRTLAYIQQISLVADRAITNCFRRALHEGVIKSKSGLAGGSKFDFKHVPQIGEEVGKEGHGRPSPPSIFSRPVESFLLIIYLLGVVIISGATITGVLLFYLLFKRARATWVMVSC